MLVSAGIICRDGRVLIGQRLRNGRHPLKWEFPGGKVEDGETPRQALARELREELEIQAEIGVELARYQHSYPSGRSVDLLFFHIADFCGDPLPRAYERIEWTPLETLPSIDFLEGDLDFVRRLASGEFALAPTQSDWSKEK